MDIPCQSINCEIKAPIADGVNEPDSKHLLRHRFAPEIAEFTVRHKEHAC